MKKQIASIFILLFFTLQLLAAQTEYGVASYYGTQFHGRPTASGEKYNQFALTAAHKTLPLGTIVKVTNAQNNKSVYVKINDRGPFIKGRVIDLSTKAAEMLGYRNKGTAYVKIEIINKEKAPDDLMEASVDVASQNGIKSNDSTTVATKNKNASWKEIPTVEDEKESKNTNGTLTTNNSEKDESPLTELKDANSEATTNRSAYYVITKLDKSKSGFYGLQLGVFSDMNTILSIIADLEADYKQPLLVEQMDLNGKTVYKLYMGKYQNRAYADALKSVLADKYNDSFVVKYE